MGFSSWKFKVEIGYLGANFKFEVKKRQSSDTVDYIENGCIHASTNTYNINYSESLEAMAKRNRALINAFKHG